MTLTPVEWLIQELKKNGKAVEHYDLLLQAKRIEKQQILDAYDEGYTDAGYADHRANHYFNETYNL